MFTKRKFLGLEEMQKHHYSAKILRHIYETILSGNRDVSKSFELYHQYLEWQEHPKFSETLDLKKISNQYHMHLAKAKRNLKEHNLLPHIRTGDHIAKKDFSNAAVFLDNIRSAYNVGSILRTTEALRIGSVYFRGNTPFSDHEKVVKASMGSANVVPCYKVYSEKDLPQPWICLETSDEAIPFSEFIFPETFTLILGNEEFGVSDELLRKSDIVVEIPLYGKKNSINVACAFAIIAAQICQQKNRYDKTHSFA